MKIALGVSGPVAARVKRLLDKAAGNEKLVVAALAQRQITVKGVGEEATNFLKDTVISKKRGNVMSLVGTTSKGTKVTLTQADTHAIQPKYQADATQFAALYSLLASTPGVAAVTLSDVEYTGVALAEDGAMEEVEF